MFNQKNLQFGLKYLLQVAIYLTLVAIPTISFLANDDDQIKIGKLFALVSLASFLLSQYPGILRRFQATGFWQQLQNILMYSRAQLGILMFLTGFAHYLFSFLLFNLKYGSFPPTLMFFEVFGLLALLGSFPLFLTSNLRSKKILKRNWARLQKLVYILIWLLFMHVATSFSQELTKYLASFALIITLVLQTSSLVWGWKK